MNKEWAEQNKEMQSLIKKAGTFEKGKDVLFGLRNDLMDTLLSFKEDFNREDSDITARILRIQYGIFSG